MLDADDLGLICRQQGLGHLVVRGVCAMRTLLIDRWTETTTRLVLDLLERNLD
jgi:hypothetical protein